jgi:hypothetical protein
MSCLDPETIKFVAMLVVIGVCGVAAFGAMAVVAWRLR